MVCDPDAILSGCNAHFFPAAPPSTSEHKLVEWEAADTLKFADTLPPPELADREIRAAINRLKPKAAAGPVGISAELLRLSLPSILQPLTEILRACVRSCYFPTSWKHAKVRIIAKHNKSDYLSLSSYRPISVINNVSRMLERIILERITWHASESEWFSDQ